MSGNLPAPTSAMPSILTLGRLIGEANRRHEAYLEQERRAPEGMDRLYINAAGKHENDRYYDLRACLSHNTATSAEEALIQAVEALNQAHLLFQYIPGEHTAEREINAFERLMYSIVRFLETQAGTLLETAGLSHLRNSNLDPWDDVHQRLADIRARWATEGLDENGQVKAGSGTR